MEIGDTVENINIKSKNYGEQGEITDVRDSDGKFEVTYDNGDVGYGQEKSYKIINGDESDIELGYDAPTKKPVKNLLTSIKDMFMSEPEKTYRALGIKDSQGNLTSEGKELLLNRLFDANEEALIRSDAVALLASQSKK